MPSNWRYLWYYSLECLICFHSWNKDSLWYFSLVRVVIHSQVLKLQKNPLIRLLFFLILVTCQQKPLAPFTPLILIWSFLQYQHFFATVIWLIKYFWSQGQSQSSVIQRTLTRYIRTLLQQSKCRREESQLCQQRYPTQIVIWLKYWYKMFKA